ncbi:hypothetical protein AAE478_009731 [Parahypoxylon ruwenzoriense]
MGFSVSLGGSGTTGSTIRVLLALAPVALPVAYLFYFKRSLALRTEASGARVAPPESLSDLLSLSSSSGSRDLSEGAIPPAVLAAPEHYVIARERVISRPVLVAGLRPEFTGGSTTASGELEGLLEAYLSATMKAFARTPQAWVLRRLGTASVRDPAAYGETFGDAYLDACRFIEGDRVCGVYVVAARPGEVAGGGRRKRRRVVLRLQPPPGWTGPVVHGVLDVGFDRVDGGEKGDAGMVVFVNETVMWRRRDGGKPTLLEGWLGSWLHELLARWLVARGVEAVIGRAKSE